MVDLSSTMSPEDRALLERGNYPRLAKRSRWSWGRTFQPIFHTGVWQAGDVPIANVVLPASWIAAGLPSVDVHWHPYQVCTSQSNTVPPSFPAFGHAITGYGDAQSRLNPFKDGIGFVPAGTFINGGSIHLEFEGWYESTVGTPNMKATFIVEPNTAPQGDIGAYAPAAPATAAVFTSNAFGGAAETRTPFKCIIDGTALGEATHHWTCEMFCATATAPLRMDWKDFGIQRLTGASGYNWKTNHVKLSARFKIDTTGDGVTTYLQTGTNLLRIERYVAWQEEEEP